jgi:hypothetical protein
MILTEEDWRACTEVDELLRYLVKNDRISSRQARLFACACCRRIWPLITDEASRHAVEVAEKYADGLVTELELVEAFESAFNTMYRPFREGWSAVPPAFSAAAACAAAEHESAEEHYSPWDYFPYAERPLQLALAGARHAAERVRYTVCDLNVGPPANPAGVYSTEQSQALDTHRNAEALAQCHLLRDIVGNPFWPVAIDTDWLAWNDGIVRRLAQRIYDERACELYPILGNALEDAGCRDNTVLDHCRQSGGHARGCWLIDALLGMEKSPRDARIFLPHAERTWLLSQDPRNMLEELLDRPWSKRKLRLFMVACCRALMHFLTEERLRQAIDLAECYADGLASAEELQTTFETIQPAEKLIWENLFQYDVASMAAAAVSPSPVEDNIHPHGGVWDLMYYTEGAVGINACELGAAVDPEEATKQAFADQANLLRDIFGNPFRYVAFDPRWRVSQVTELAQIIYDERAFHRMPELARALELAGCDYSAILDHCRSPGPHVRGCWVIDLLLSRS